jgi:serralysin
MPTTPLSKDKNINSLLSTYQWGIKNGQEITVTFSFPESQFALWTDYDFKDDEGEPLIGWYPLSKDDQDNFRSALSLWSEVANITFKEITEKSTSVGDIRVAFSEAVKQEGFSGWAYLPVTDSNAQSGDIWLHPDDTNYSIGTRNYLTLVHEIGHAIGLKHPFDQDPENNQTLKSKFDSTQYTVMSYTDYEDAGFIYSKSISREIFVVQPTTVMLYDIAAIQFLYGANTTTRTGNDIYTFSNSQGELKTIWDAGGTDSFDLSNQEISQTINLNAGEFSSLGIRQKSTSKNLTEAVDNVAIAYTVEIENAVGGSGDDVIMGNSLKNSLAGGAGNDTISARAGDDTVGGGVGNDSISGGGGNDTLLGNEGNDTLIGGKGNDTYSVNSLTDVVTERANEGVDTIRSSINWTLGQFTENLTLQGNALRGNGNGLDNQLIGNSINNVLNGNSGNDILNGKGGADTLTGGSGKDIFVFDNIGGIDTVTDFSVVADTFQLENAVFKALGNAGNLTSGQLVFGTNAIDGNDHLIYTKANGMLYYDSDGNGSATKVTIATLGVNLALSNADFVII